MLNMKVLTFLLFLLAGYVNSDFIETEIRSSSCLGSLSFHHYHTDEVITKVNDTTFKVTLSSGRETVKMRMEGNCCFYIFNKEKCRGEIRKPLNTDTVRSAKQGGKISVVKMDSWGNGCKANQTAVRSICKERMNRFQSLKSSAKPASKELLVGHLLNKMEDKLDGSIIKTYSNMEQNVTDVLDPKIYIRKDEKDKVKIVGESHTDIVNKTEQVKFNITEDLESIYEIKEKELKQLKDRIENIFNKTDEKEVKIIDELTDDIHTKTKKEVLINEGTEALPLADFIEDVFRQSNDKVIAVDKYEQSKLTILDDIGSANVTSTVDAFLTEIDSTEATNVEPTVDGLLTEIDSTEATNVLLTVDVNQTEIDSTEATNIEPTVDGIQTEIDSIKATNVEPTVDAILIEISSTEATSVEPTVGVILTEKDGTEATNVELTVDAILTEMDSTEATNVELTIDAIQTEIDSTEATNVEPTVDGILTEIDSTEATNIEPTVDASLTEKESNGPTNMEPTIVTTLKTGLTTINTIDVYTEITEITTMERKDVKHETIEISTINNSEVKYETAKMIKMETTDVNYKTTEMATIESTDNKYEIKEVITVESTDVKHETTLMETLEGMGIKHESIEMISMESVDVKTNDDEQSLIENNNIKIEDEESFIMESKPLKTGIPGISTKKTTYTKTDDEVTIAKTDETSSMDITDMITKESKIPTKDISDISIVNPKTTTKMEEASEISTKNVTNANNISPQTSIKETKILKSKAQAIYARNTTDVNAVKTKVPINLKTVTEETIATKASKNLTEETTIVKTTDVKQPMFETATLHAADKPALGAKVKKIVTNEDAKYKEKMYYKENGDTDSTEGYFISKSYNEASAIINDKNKETRYLPEKRVGINTAINDTFNTLKRQEDDIMRENRATRAQTKYGFIEVVKYRYTFENTTLRKYTRIDQGVVSGTEEIDSGINWNIEHFQPTQTNHDSSYDSLINQTNKILGNKRLPDGSDVNYTNNSEETLSGRKRSSSVKSTDTSSVKSTDKTETVIYKFDKAQSYVGSSNSCCTTFSNISRIQLLLTFSIFLMQYYYK